MTEIMTADREYVTEGDRVFNFYDGYWGTIGRIESDGWFSLTREDGSRGAYLNGARVCVIIPWGNPWYGKA